MKIWNNKAKTNEWVDKFTASSDRHYDLYLVEYDCLASIAHAEMLAKTKLIAPKEAEDLIKELNHIIELSKKDQFKIEDEFEDIHSKIEFMLTKTLGNVGKKIHTGRSRNDQVLVAMQLYLRDELMTIKQMTQKFINDLLELAEKYKDDLMPGYTHLQVAMPSSFGLWVSAYAETLIDDLLFLDTAYHIINQNPLGSAAGFGSSFDIDREMTTKQLRFEDIKINSLSAQFNRGKVEKAVAIAIGSLSATISKLMYDICLYLGQDYNFISFPTEITTGSSIMPHKKNPDIFELIRAKCNLLQNTSNQLTLLNNNLPSGYHRDFQLNKKIIIDAIVDFKEVLDILLVSIKDIEVNKDILEQKKYEYIFSVEAINQKIAEGESFRDAYMQIKQNIESGTYQADKNLNHKHLGSIGNLGLGKIRNKLDKSNH